jgi:hypothetical protein
MLVVEFVSASVAVDIGATKSDGSGSGSPSARKKENQTSGEKNDLILR